MKGWDLISHNIILSDPGSPVQLVFQITNLKLLSFGITLSW